MLSTTVRTHLPQTSEHKTKENPPTIWPTEAAQSAPSMAPYHQLCRWRAGSSIKVVILSAQNYCRRGTYLPTRLPGSNHLAKGNGTPPPIARLFTTDATAMYTNIEPDVGIAAVQQWLIDLASELPEKFPSVIVINTLKMVMTRNTFQFDETYWQQFVVTTMGTPCVCVYGTVAYGYHERTNIIPKQTKETMPYLKRFIDDMPGIWCGSDADWIIFKTSINGFGRLKWICSECVTLVTFLDLTITIDATSKTIHTKTYQKLKNLHLYIPATSAHPEA
jgi:hypothetical protein